MSAAAVALSALLLLGAVVFATQQRAGRVSVAALWWRWSPLDHPRGALATTATDAGADFCIAPRCLHALGGGEVKG